MARDAHTGGDPVAAENYLQHAEHYFRLIAAAQAAQALAQSGQARPAGEADADDLEDDADFGTLDRFASPSERTGAPYQQPQQGFQPQPGPGPGAPQPFVERNPYEVDRQGSNDRGGYPNRQDRQGNRFPDRVPRPDRPFAERGENYRDNRQGRDGRPREFRPYRDPAAQPVRDAGPDAPAPTALPSFITASPRPGGAIEPTDAAPPPSVSSTPSGAHEPGHSAPDSSPGESAFPGRVRRRRLRSPYGFNGVGAGEAELPPSSAPEITDEPQVND